jgi:hydrogenase-1 operon protein HyaE
MSNPIPMPLAAGADALAHPLIAQLFTKHGFTAVDAANIDAFAATPGRTLLLFVEDPVRYKETLDLAVIVPELVRAFPGRFAVGVVLPEAARALQPRYGFRRWPAFVMLADGHYVGAVDGLRDWSEYGALVADLLAAPPTRPPTIGIAVTGPGGDAASCHS